MITIVAQIDLLSGEQSSDLTLNSASENFIGNNISADLNNIVNSPKKATNPFLLGVSKFKDGAVLTNKVDYFISKELCDENGNFASNFVIEISGGNIKNFTLSFDDKNNRYPKSIFVNNVEQVVDEPIVLLHFEETSNSHTIKINNWNSPNRPLVITGIYVDMVIDVDYSNLLNFNNNIVYKGDIKLPSYGIISNVGNITFNDNDGSVKRYAENLLLDSGASVQVWVCNTILNTKEKVADLLTNEWDYDNYNREVSVSLKDDLEEWQDIQVQGFGYDPREPFKVIADGKMSNVYKWLQDKDENGNYRTPQKYNMLSFDELDEETRNVLENTTVSYPFLENSTLWDEWSKLCQVCGLYIYKNNQGQTICTYSYGS